MLRLNYSSRSLLSFVTFNLGWWVCALGPRYGMSWIGPLTMPIWLGLHIYFSPTKWGEALFLITLGLLGFVIDTFLIHTGIFYIIPNSLFAPPWLICMWMLLGMTFESMLVMRKNVLMMCLMGVLSGPLSYIFAQAVDILRYSNPQWISMSIHGLLWAAMMPLLFSLRDTVLEWTIQFQEELQNS